VTAFFELPFFLSPIDLLQLPPELASLCEQDAGN